jgi:hypothetical protein
LGSSPWRLSTRPTCGTLAQASCRRAARQGVLPGGKDSPAHHHSPRPSTHHHSPGWRQGRPTAAGGRSFARQAHHSVFLFTPLPPPHLISRLLQNSHSDPKLTAMPSTMQDNMVELRQQPTFPLAPRINHRSPTFFEEPQARLHALRNRRSPWQAAR